MWWRPVQKQLMTILGRLKYFSRPPVIVFDPSSYKVKGPDVRELINILQPGDILLRAYDGYLDSWFIRHSWPQGSQRKPRAGRFTHVALYVGYLAESDRARASSQINGYDWDSDRKAPAADLPQIRESARKQFFDPVLSKGGQGEWPDNRMVVHAMAEGVQLEDILTFCRCDYLAVMRLPESAAEGVASRDDLIRQAVETSLARLGAEYDFNCADVNQFQSFSCAQLVYYCYRQAAGLWQMTPRWHGLFGRFMLRLTVTPDDFTEAGLECVWQSRSLRAIRTMAASGKGQ